MKKEFLEKEFEMMKAEKLRPIHHTPLGFNQGQVLWAFVFCHNHCSEQHKERR